MPSWPRSRRVKACQTDPIIVTLAVEYGVAEQEMSSTLLLSALVSPVTLGAFIAVGS